MLNPYVEAQARQVIFNRLNYAVPKASPIPLTLPEVEAIARGVYLKPDQHGMMLDLMTYFDTSGSDVVRRALELLYETVTSTPAVEVA